VVPNRRKVQSAFHTVAGASQGAFAPPSGCSPPIRARSRELALGAGSRRSEPGAAKPERQPGGSGSWEGAGRLAFDARRTRSSSLPPPGAGRAAAAESDAKTAALRSAPRLRLCPSRRRRRRRRRCGRGRRCPAAGPAACRCLREDGCGSGCGGCPACARMLSALDGALRRRAGSAGSDSVR